MRVWLERAQLPFLILVIGLWTFGLLFGSATGAEVRTIDPSAQRIWLNDQLSYYRDPSERMSFEEIRGLENRGQFHPINGTAIATAFPPGTPTWIHFAVRYPVDSSCIWWLLLTPDVLPSITLYAEQADGTYSIHQGGSALPSAEREMPGPGHAFMLGQNAGGLRHYFIRVTGLLGTRVEPSLWQQKALMDYLGRNRAIFGIFLGLFSVLIVMALMRALRYRKPLDIAYFGYILGSEMHSFSHNGFLQASGLVESQTTREAFMQFGLLIAGLSFLTVTRTLIVWPTGSIWPVRLLRTGLGLTLLILAVVAVAFPRMLIEVNFDQAIFWILASGVMGLWGAWRGYPNARIFTLCFLPFVLWAGTMSLVRWLAIPLPDTFTRYLVLMITSTLHLCTLWYLILSKDARLERAKRQLENQLSALRNEMSHINLFMGLLGHELNRPLNALATLVQENAELAEPGPEPIQRPRLSAIYGEFSEILKTCMDRMRQAAVTQLDIKPVDLGELIKGLTEQFHLRKTTHLIRSDTTSLPANFQCDPRLISILLVNLVENALSYSPAGGAVWVSGKQVDADTIELRVTDEGPGIPASAKEKIFERYVRLNTTTTQRQGMGLGLFIVKRIAEMHGGSVLCESDPGEGASFRVFLKRCEPNRMKA